MSDFYNFLMSDFYNFYNFLMHKEDILGMTEFDVNNSRCRLLFKLLKSRNEVQ